jgi:diacylglycerol kinase family enzyme
MRLLMLEQEEAEQRALAPAAKIVCILNGASGSNRGAQAKELVTDLFARHGAPARILLARKGSELGDLARDAVEQGSRVVVAGGGDGTISTVTAALVGTEAALGVLPLGTLNHFAKDLQIPLDLEAAVATIFTGGVVSIDVGEVNGRIFLNNSSIGIYPWIVREREQEQKKGHGKWAAFGLALLSVLKRYSLLHARLRVDEEDGPEARTPFVFIGNNPYESQGLNIGQRRALDLGRLWVLRAPPAGRGRLFLLALQHAFGKGRVPELEIFDAHNVSVRTRAARLLVAADGEVISLETPLQYGTLPGALRVIVPAATDVASAQQTDA